MTDQLVNAFTNLRIDAAKWRFIDLRIDIPPYSFGSDAINPHTQYSNPIAFMEFDSDMAVGAAFTLGAGNDMLCKAAEYIVSELDGLSVSDLINSKSGFYETLTNPLQLRWLSPNAGLPMMASGLVVNTLLDAASKSVGLPAWEFLARMPSDLLINLINIRHLNDFYSRSMIYDILETGLLGIDERCEKLKSEGLPVYFTTWIGHDVQTISNQILSQHRERGIQTFKLKIGPEIKHDTSKLLQIKKLLPAHLTLCVDANQTLSLKEAKQWLRVLSDCDIKWLEEPFAPDNIRLFADLVQYKRNHSLSCEIVTGENCPNYFTAAALMNIGIDRFQVDPCRMLGLIDSVLVCIIASISKCMITPHAGGSALDELSPHIQLFNLARIGTELSSSGSLTENVGFCSHHFAVPTTVKDGRAKTHNSSGLLVGLAETSLIQTRDYKEGTSWLKL